MKLHFEINPYYLLQHSLQRSWDRKPFPEWMRLARKARAKAPILFDPARALVDINDAKALGRTFQITQKTLDILLRSVEFRRLLQETKEYRTWVEDEWRRESPAATRLLREITGLPLPSRSVTVLITHPALRNGSNIPEKSLICWGHSEDWEHYTVVYLCHEILHILTHRKYTDEHVMHAIIELAVDNELRIRLHERGRYFKEGRYLVGHADLRSLEQEVLPLWRKYLRGNLRAKNLISFERWVTKQGLSFRKNHRSG